MKTLKLYWSTALKEGKKNFGDWLSPKICECLSGRKIILETPARCDLMAVGSILQKAKNYWFGRSINVWGSGFIEAHAPVTSKHHYHALRGQLSARQLFKQNDPVYGDPGLLANLLVSKISSQKQYCIGIVPHYKEQDNSFVRSFIERYPHVKLISVFEETETFIKNIAACDIVLSSSLHGLVVADSLKIPNAWIKLSNDVRGDGFKFQDYYSAFDLYDIKPFSFDDNTKKEDLIALVETYHRSNLEEIKQNLINSFPFAA